MRSQAVARSNPLRSLDPRSSLAALPQRVRERRFWVVQILIVSVVGSHYLVELLGTTNPYETMHGLSITLFVIPMVVASLSYDWEGAVHTTVLGVVLLIPSIIIWHPSASHWFAESGQLLATLPVGVLVAWRVGLERNLSSQVERRASDLGLLNRIGAQLRSSIEETERLPAVLDVLVQHLELEAAWFVLPGENEPNVVHPSGRGKYRGGVDLLASFHERIVEDGNEILSEGGNVGVALRGDSLEVGSLIVRPLEGIQLSSEDEQLLTALGDQLGAFLRNAQLYRERQENLRSYAQQLTQTQEDERLRISRELHDDTAQELVHLVRSIEQVREWESQRRPTHWAISPRRSGTRYPECVGLRGT